MKKSFLLATSVLLFNALAYGWSGWLCQPQKGPKTEPWIAVVKTEAPNVVTFVLSQDLTRENGKLPVGEYRGRLEKSKSGFSYFAWLNVKDYFSDSHYAGLTPWVSLVLPTRPTGMTSEGWLFWGDPQGDFDGEPLNQYGCRIVD